MPKSRHSELVLKKICTLQFTPPITPSTLIIQPKVKSLGLLGTVYLSYWFGDIEHEIGERVNVRGVCDFKVQRNGGRKRF